MSIPKMGMIVPELGMTRNRQRGIMLYGALAALLAFAGVSAYAYVQTQRLEACNEKYDRFRLEVKAKGEAAIENARKIDSENAKRKEKSDAERKRMVIANADLARRLRDSASESSLPRPANDTGIPETACFHRADLDAAIRKFTAGIAGIVTQGDAAVTDLDLAKRWAEK
jgi:hypothetical protein